MPDKEYEWYKENPENHKYNKKYIDQICAKVGFKTLGFRDI